VVFYGDGFFVDGKLLYRHEHQTIFIKPTEGERTFLVNPTENA
jgi:hypothetical protein